MGKFTLDGVFITEWLEGYSWPLGHVDGLALDAAGNVYVANVGGGRAHVDEFTPTGSPIARFGNLDYTVPKGAAVNSEGEVYLLCRDLDQVFIFAPDGSLLTTVGGYGAEPGELINPLGLGLNSADELYVADSGNYRVQKFSASGATPVRVGTWGRLKGLYR